MLWGVAGCMIRRQFGPYVRRPVGDGIRRHEHRAPQARWQQGWALVGAQLIRVGYCQELEKLWLLQSQAFLVKVRKGQSWVKVAFPKGNIISLETMNIQVKEKLLAKWSCTEKEISAPRFVEWKVLEMQNITELGQDLRVLGGAVIGCISCKCGLAFQNKIRFVARDFTYLNYFQQFIQWHLNKGRQANGTQCLKETFAGNST